MIDESDVLSDLDQIRSRYEILRRLGFDGACAIHGVRSPASGRHFALKVMDNQGSTGARPGVLHPWQAHTMEKLEHPNLMPVHAVHHLQGGAVAVAVERRRGRTLWEWIQEYGPLPLTDVERVLREIGDALAYLHARGVVHRAIRPQSVFLDRDCGRARLALFGIDGGAGEPAEATALSIVRSLAFLAPEQIDAKGRVDGAKVSARSDLYSLGLVGYAMLTGGEPWSGASAEELLQARRAGAPLPVESVRGDIPRYLSDSLESCLDPKPSRRWKEVAELLARLEAGDQVVTTRVAERGAPVSRRIGEIGATIGAAAVSAASRFPSADVGGLPSIRFIESARATLGAALSALPMSRPLPPAKLAIPVAMLGLVVVIASRGGGSIEADGRADLDSPTLELRESATTVVQEPVARSLEPVEAPARLADVTPEPSGDRPVRVADRASRRPTAPPRPAPAEPASGEFVLLGEPVVRHFSAGVLSDPIGGNRYR